MDRREDVGEVYPGGGFAGGHGGAIEDIVAALAELSNVSRELAQRIDGKVDKGDFAALELGDGATQKEVRQMLQNVLGKLKGLSACAAAMLSFAAFAIEPDIAWEDMPPTNKVRDVVEQFAPAPGDYAAVSNAAMNAVRPQSMTNYATRAELEAGWWSEWGLNGIPDGYVKERLFWSLDDAGWKLVLRRDSYFFVAVVEADEDTPDSLTFNFLTPDGSFVVTATRHRVAAPVPTKPEDIGAASTADLEPLLFAQYYPDGSVKSAAEFTADIKYDFATNGTERTATVRPFVPMPSDNNSNLEGRVVIPPLVDAQGNPYLTDDGTLYRVVGVSGGNTRDFNVNLTAIIAPSTVTTVGDNAFYKCTRLVSASFPATISIGGSVFERCGSLVSVSFPSATTIGPGAFTYCGSLASVSLPSAITIKNGAFMYCDSLASVSLPCVQVVEAWAFCDCNSLVSISLPSVTSVANNSFSYCDSLKSLDFPVLPNAAGNSMQGNVSLEQVSLYAATNIAGGALKYCYSLKSVNFGAKPRAFVPQCRANSFTDVPRDCVFIIPDEQYNAWTAPTIPDPEHEGESITNRWYGLVQAGYRFLRHSEWEYARRADVAAVASALDERTYVITTNTTTATRTTNDVWLANWDKSIVLRPAVTTGSSVGNWSGGGYELYCEPNSAASQGYAWTLQRNGGGGDQSTIATNTVPTLNFGMVNGVRYTLTRYGSYSIKTNTVLKAAKDYTDQQASAALTIVAGMAETIERNAVNAATQYVKAAPVEIPAAAAAKGVTFECAKPDPANPSATCGEEDNGAVAIGRNAKAAVTAAALNAAPSNTVGRSVSVAIGAEADATVSASATKNQAVAIGWHAQAKASNAVAIGGGAQHTFEDAMSGAAAYANASEAVAVGYSAKATANGAVQFGLGTNTTAKSFQFREWQVVNGRGQIPAERLADAADEIAGGMLSQLERLVSPGNMAVMYGGDDDQHIEPRLDGVCEVLMQPDTNGVWMAGAEAYVVPPLGSRNYDLVITNIPQAFRWDRSGEEPTLVPLPEDQNFLFDFSELPQEITPTLRCAASIGYVRGRSMVITNAPLVVRMRQPATNRVVVVVKPWDEMEL